MADLRPLTKVFTLIHVSIERVLLLDELKVWLIIHLDLLCIYAKVSDQGLLVLLWALEIRLYLPKTWVILNSTLLGLARDRLNLWHIRLLWAVRNRLKICFRSSFIVELLPTFFEFRVFLILLLLLCFCFFPNFSIQSSKAGSLPCLFSQNWINLLIEYALYMVHVKHVFVCWKPHTELLIPHHWSHLLLIGFLMTFYISESFCEDKLMTSFALIVCKWALSARTSSWL